MHQFDIDTNEYLRTATIGYYHEAYPIYNKENPHPVNILKNTYDSKDSRLSNARDHIISKIITDIPIIIKAHDLDDCVLVNVPRSKANLSSNQLKFKEAVSMASNKLKVTDGTRYIVRNTNTKTTHLPENTPDFDNDGAMPYAGITEATCSIDSNNIKDQNIILIDDVYTKGSNIIEDCIQTLLDHGAKCVIHYSICKTQKGN